MKKKLTALAIPTLPEGQYPDALTPGLILRVGKNRRTWECRYRKGGKRHADRIGYFPAMGLAEARETAAALLKRVEAGLAAPAVQKIIHPQSPDALTLGKLIDKYEAMRRMKGGRIKRLDAALRTVRNGLADYLNYRSLNFRKPICALRATAIAKRAPLQANRFLAYLGPVMKWAAAEDHVPVNFVPDVLKTASETKRERTLTHAETEGDLASLRPARRWTFGASVWPYGPFCPANPAAARRVRFAEVRRSARRHLDTARKQGQSAASSQAAAGWRSIWSGSVRRATSSFPGRPARSPVSRS